MERYELLKGVDAGKDQSYVLFTLGQSELSRLLLPVGEYPKEEIRKMAAESVLLVADKPDSPGDLLHTQQQLPRVRG